MSSHDVTGTGLFDMAKHLLTPSEQRRQRAVLGAVKDALGPGGTAPRVAEMVREVVA